MKNKYLLDENEADLLKTFEAGEWKKVTKEQEVIKTHSDYAKATIKKEKRVNIRISGKDLESIQRKALAEGLPYQTLIASLLHKYVSGKIVEKISK